MPADSGVNPAEIAKRVVEMIRKVVKEAEVETKLGMADIGVEAVNEMKKILSQPGGGRTYRRHGVLHRASAPGDPPAVDTGKYRASWNYQVGDDAEGPFVEVGTNDKRGPWLEFGTRRMKARPHVRPMVERLTIKIPGLISDAYANGMERAVGRLPAEVKL